MHIEDYRRIFDFFFSGVEVSEELKQQFLGWLAVHGDDPQVRSILEEYWRAASSAAPEFDITEGLEKLMARLEGDLPAVPKESSRSMQTTSVKGSGKDSAEDAASQEKPVESTRASRGQAPVSSEHKGPGKKLFGNRMWKYAIAAAAAAGLFLTGAFTSALVTGQKKETVLMAS